MRGALALLAISLATALAGCGPQEPETRSAAPGRDVREVKMMTGKETTSTPTVSRTDDEWRRELSPEQYRVLRQAGTEAPFTGRYWNHHEDGTYTCAGCGAELFRSHEKYDSGCGWPSFYEALDKSRIVEREDLSHGMRRTEVLCKQCGGHLGHLFDDGPAPTGMRYCINSASLDFRKDTGESKDR